MIRWFALLVLTPVAAMTADPLPPEAVYPPKLAPGVAGPNNPEMRALMEADQAGRKVDKIDWASLSRADDARRERVRVLLDAGELRTGADYYFAAFIFQHGSKPEDYLLAHALAVSAIGKGTDARWISAATLDRYLQSVGRPQIYGTQSMKNSGERWTQEPYDRQLLPNRIRIDENVPTLAEADGELNAR